MKRSSSGTPYPLSYDHHSSDIYIFFHFSIMQMITCMECYKTYGTPEALKRHVRYTHNTSTVECRWCPYEVSSNVRLRMKDHKKKQHWYKYHTETAAPLRTSNHHHNNKKDKNQKIEPKADKKEKIKSVVTSNGSSKSSKEKQSKSTSSTTAKGASTTSEKENLKPLSPLREPSPFDLEFEDLLPLIWSLRA